MGKVATAIEWAIKAHKDQFRKGEGGLPFIVHPARTSEAARIFFEENPDAIKPYGMSEVVCAMWLHDIVEDTDISLERLGVEFGTRVRDIVAALTNNKQLGFSRSKQKLYDRIGLAPQRLAIRSMKLIDRLDNVRSLCDMGDGAFREQYATETLELIAWLHRGEDCLEFTVRCILEEIEPYLPDGLGVRLGPSSEGTRVLLPTV